MRAERRYVFAGISGQEVHFDMFEVPASFEGWLKWELKSPSGKSVFSAFAVQPLQRTLEETGDYSLRVWVGISDPGLLGSFAFRTWCEVVALPDSLTAAPGSEVAIPFTSLMCNDSSGVGDRPEVKLISATSAQGGAIQTIGSQLRYTPPSSFTGVDRFQYRLEGLFGGSSTTEVRVVVAPDVAAHAMVVSLTRDLDGGASVCLLGTPETEYRVEQATEFGSWTFLRSVRTDSEGKLSFHYLPDSQLQRFYRFRKP